VAAPEPFALTPKLLARHGFAGRVLALPPSALGRLVQLFASAPPASTPWALQGRRADAQTWASLVERQPKASAGPSCESCGGTGRCAQCSGIGCSVCDMTGKCQVCEGAGTIEKPHDPDDDPDSDDPESSSGGYAMGPVVSVVTVRGLLASEVTRWECGVSDGYQGQGGIVDRWRMAHADPVSCAVVLDAMAPGGDALLCMESAAEMAAITAASGKPSFVYASEATSAMYALACGAAGPGGFCVAPSADVANVGTRTWHVDRSAKNEKDGIVVTHFGDPPGKILGNPDEPLDDEARARIERDIKESTERFVAFVAQQRGMTPEAVRDADADTRRGAAAVAAGFADRVANSLSEVVALAYGQAMAAVQPTTIASSPSMDDDPEDDMKLTPETLQALGLKPGATASDVEAAAKSLAARPVATLLAVPETTGDDPLRALGSVALDALGGGDVMDALIEVPRRLARGASAPTVEVERDELRRERAWGNAITSGAFAAGEVWRQTEVDGQRAKAYTPMAAALNAAYPDVAKLEQRLEKLPKLSRGAVAPVEADADLARAADEQRQSVALSPRWQALAVKNGINPAALAARAAQNLGLITTEPSS